MKTVSRVRVELEVNEGIKRKVYLDRSNIFFVRQDPVDFRFGKEVNLKKIFEMISRTWGVQMGKLDRLVLYNGIKINSTWMDLKSKNVSLEFQSDTNLPNCVLSSVNLISNGSTISVDVDSTVEDLGQTISRRIFGINKVESIVYDLCARFSHDTQLTDDSKKDSMEVECLRHDLKKKNEEIESLRSKNQLQQLLQEEKESSDLKKMSSKKKSKKRKNKKKKKKKKPNRNPQKCDEDVKDENFLLKCELENTKKLLQEKELMIESQKMFTELLHDKMKAQEEKLKKRLQSNEFEHEKKIEEHKKIYNESIRKHFHTMKKKKDEEVEKYRKKVESKEAKCEEVMNRVHCDRIVLQQQREMFEREVLRMGVMLEKVYLLRANNYEKKCIAHFGSLLKFMGVRLSDCRELIEEFYLENTMFDPFNFFGNEEEKKGNKKG